MEIKIRRAEKNDCPRLLELVQELAEFEKAPQEVTVSLSHFEKSGFGEKPVWWSFVATTSQDHILGFALYYIRFSTWKGQAMYLEDILVTKEMRGTGIGKLLMDRLIAEAMEKGFRRINWQVLEWNKAAVEFYKKYGTTIDGEWLNCFIDIA